MRDRGGPTIEQETEAQVEEMTRSKEDLVRREVSELVVFCYCVTPSVA